MKKLMKKHPLLEEKKPKKEPIETGKTLGGNMFRKTLGNEDKTLGGNTTGDNSLGGEKGKQPNWCFHCQSNLIKMSNSSPS
jgi:hypothetical protein